MKINRQLTKQIIQTYAQNLFEAADVEERVFEDVKALQYCAQVIRSHHELHEALSSDILPADKRFALVQDVFSEQVSPEVAKVVGVLAEREEIELLGRVAEVYRELAEEQAQVVITEVTTAVPLDGHLRQVITDKLNKEFGKSIHLEEKVDPSIIGGVIINAQGKRIDASIASQLIHARTVLSKSVSIGGEN